MFHYIIIYGYAFARPLQPTHCDDPKALRKSLQQNVWMGQECWHGPSPSPLAQIPYSSSQGACDHPWNASAGSEPFKGYLGGGFVCRANLYLARRPVDITWKGLLKNRLMRRAIKGEWWREWKQLVICIALHQRVIALEWNSWTPSKGKVWTT